jgi:hypothetical protein
LEDTRVVPQTIDVTPAMRCDIFISLFIIVEELAASYNATKVVKTTLPTAVSFK